MRIIYIGTFRLPFFDAAAARVLNVSRSLRLAGHEVNFISWGGAQSNSDYCDDSITHIDGFPFIVTNEMDFKGGIISKAKGWLTHGNKTKKLLKEQLGNYDVIISYNCSLINWLIPFCRKHNIYLVSDLTEWYSYRELKLIELPGYFINMYCSQRKVKNKIVISSFLNNYYKDSHNIVVPATCDSTETKWQIGAQKRKSIDGTFDGITLFYAGTPARKDAVHYVIGAVQRLIDEGVKMRFMILGINREDYLTKYSDLLPQKDLNERILFLGRVPQEDVPSYYAIADFMVLLREQTRKSNAGFPTKFSESIISGTPVIANLTSDLKRYLQDGITGFVVENPSEDAIYYTLKDKVSLLSRDDVNVLKSNVRSISVQLDYHSFVEPLRDFMDNLKI